MKTDGVNVNEPIETVPYGAMVIPDNRLKYWYGNAGKCSKER